MEYIKKEDLIKDEVYINNNHCRHIFKYENDLYNCINIYSDKSAKINTLFKRGNFTNNKLVFTKATPQEKHWLERCIAADKFIEFTEAMKTFEKELPQFKIIESIETITKVENNEGNQFFIGDVVISSNGTIQTIESFGYNKAKTNIIAFTNKQSILGNGIGINKIEHYIEPKVEETLLEKAKRLYPIGTKFKAARGSNGEYKVQSNSEFRENGDGAICIKTQGNGTIYYNGVWGEIIE